MKNRMVPFSWYGGKTSHLKWLLPMIDSTPHMTYVEPFGGSAAVLLNKKSSCIEVYNDLYSDVVNFFSVLRNRSKELLALLELTPYSREEFAASCSKVKNDDDELERARKFFIRARQVRTGLATCATPGRWSYDIKTGGRRGMAMGVSRWLNAIDGLEDVCMRLKQVQLENLDALDVINRYDTENTLHYIDPPYLMTTRSGGVGYNHEYAEEQHLQLLSNIKMLKGKVILSGYSNELYNDELADWHRYDCESKSAASARHSDNSSVRQEVIWSNYDVKKI